MGEALANSPFHGRPFSPKFPHGYRRDKGNFIAERSLVYLPLKTFP